MTRKGISDRGHCRNIRSAPKRFLFNYSNRTPIKKVVELHPIARSTHWGLRIALSVETSNVEKPHEMHIYNDHQEQDTTIAVSYSSWRMIIHLIRASSLLCFWRICLSLRSSSESKLKRTENAFLICMCSYSFMPWERGRETNLTCQRPFFRL